MTVAPPLWLDAQLRAADRGVEPTRSAPRADVRLIRRDAGRRDIRIEVPLAAGAEPGGNSSLLRCGLRNAASAAVEHWRLDRLAGGGTMRRVDAWYAGDAARSCAGFDRLPLGYGLPGLACELDTPIYVGNLANSEIFMRHAPAMQGSLYHGLAVPIPGIAGDILVLMSSEDVPLARRIEVWRRKGDTAILISGYCCNDGILRAPVRLPKPASARSEPRRSRVRIDWMNARGTPPSERRTIDRSGGTRLLNWTFAKSHDEQRILRVVL